jgi:hypothetical protein
MIGLIISTWEQIEELAALALLLLIMLADDGRDED